MKKATRWMMLCTIFFLLCMTKSYAETITVVSFDGLGIEHTTSYMKEGYMPHLQKLQQEGLHAENIVTVLPSLTAPSHAALATGAYPQKTGIVSNHLHLEGEEVQEDQSGFAQSYDVPPIWQVAQQQGKTTATVGFPGSNPEKNAAATYAVYSGGTLAKAKVHKLKFTEKAGEQVASVRLSLANKPNQYIYITKSAQNYYISVKDGVQGEAVVLNEWGAQSLDVAGLESAGFHFKVRENAEDGQLELFQGTIMGGQLKGPAKFAEQIVAQYGFYPPPDEEEAFLHGDLTRREYEEAGERFIEWTTNVSLFIKEQLTPDLLYVYYPHVDHELHKFLLVDQKQANYSLAELITTAEYRKWAFVKADETIGQWHDATGESDALFIVSDHGLEPMYKRISPNEVLKRAGYLVYTQDGKINNEKTVAHAEASGTMAHVYLNIKGREKAGIVEEKDIAKVTKEIKKLFEEQVIHNALPLDAPPSYHPFESEPFHMPYPLSLQEAARPVHMYEQILAKGDTAYDELVNSNTGDIVLFAASGYLMGRDAKTAIEPSEEWGSHGSDPEKASMRPVLYAIGEGLPTGPMINRLSVVDLAPTLYDMLHIPTPTFVDGHSILK